MFLDSSAHSRANLRHAVDGDLLPDRCSVSWQAGREGQARRAGREGQAVQSGQVGQRAGKQDGGWAMVGRGGRGRGGGWAGGKASGRKDEYTWQVRIK